MDTEALVVPEGAPNLAVAKDFLKYSIQPKVLAALLKVGLGRRLPPMKSIVENDKAYSLDPKNEPLAASTQQGIYGPTIAPYEVFNPARAQVATEKVFILAILDVINKGVTPEAAVDFRIQAHRGDLRPIPDPAKLTFSPKLSIGRAPTRPRLAPERHHQHVAMAGPRGVERRHRRYAVIDAVVVGTAASSGSVSVKLPSGRRR